MAAEIAWEKVFGPVGLDLGAEDPQEIAWSICAEILAVSRGDPPAISVRSAGAVAGRDMTVAAIVLAAGAARRFGATKQLAQLEGRPLVDYAVAAAIHGGCSPVLVVVGHDADAVGSAVAARPKVHVVHNPCYRSGQASSLRTGLEALPPCVEAVAVLLGDEPDVDAGAVRACVSTWQGGVAVVRTRYDDGVGHPVVFDRSVWPRLTTLDGDAGARVIMEELHDVGECRIRGRRPRDVDLPGDLRQIRDARRTKGG